MSITAYEYGTPVRCSNVFADDTGTAVDPTAVLFQFKTPALVTTLYTYGTDAELVRDSVGHYHVDLNGNAVGTWYYRFYSTGTGQTAAESYFVIMTSAFA